MKRCVSVCLCLSMLLMLLPVGAISTVAAAEKLADVILNVKDFGAVGDGKTDDEAAIWAAFECALMDYMIKDIPVTVYFPEGQYGLKNGGLYVYLPRGAGNLTVKGDGADKSTIVYLDEWTNSGSWVALRIYPKITPTALDEYLHDITIQDLGVYDTDPVKHAWHKDKGDPDTEETHGFNIQHCVRATIKNCKVDSVGDEAIDMSHCIDSVMRDNLVVNSPGAGSAGGAISVGDGSKNVLITNNTVIGSIDDPNKINWAIAVEALTEYVEDVTIIDNQIQDIAGWGINLGAPNGTMTDIVIHSNTIYHCRDGGIRLNGKGTATNTQIYDNTIERTRYGIFLDGSNKVGTWIEDCTIENVSGYAVSIGSVGQRDTVVQDVTIRNAKWRAFYNAGVNTTVDRLFVDGSGTAGNVTDSAVIQYTGGGDCTISNSVFLNCQNKRGIQGVAKVLNTYIQQPDVSGYTAMNGVMEIRNCRVNRAVTVKSGCVVDGLVLYTNADLGTHAIVLSNLTDCIVKNCRITIPSRYGISEAGTADNNTITNNAVIGGSGIKTVGANTVVADNVRGTLAAAEQFSYYIVDDHVTVATLIDPALTEVEIPATLEGCPVTAIDPWAFALCACLTSVTIPDNLTAVGNNAFAYCTALTAVYYGGLEPQRQQISVGIENGSFTAASWAYHWNNHSYDNACDPDCNDCGFARDVQPHAYEAVTTAPDCVNGGYTTYTCTACGDSYVADETAALGHAYEAVTTAPDCVNGGYTTYTCTACGDSYVADETAALGHAYETVITAPDCVNGGYTTYTCTACGDSYVADETAALGHAYDNVCDADCNLCGEVREVGDHVYDDDKDATCNECGFERVVVTPGDANGDGKVNNRDLGLLQQYLNDWNVEVILEAADLNGDGKVNNRDLGMLQQQLNA